MLLHRLMLATALVSALPVAAQTSIGPNGIRSGSTVIDSSGVHTATSDVGPQGVRAHDGTPGGQTVLTNGGTRSINCGGKALTLEGNSNHLTLTRCSPIQIDGNLNVVRARFDEPGRIAVSGNRNVVSWSAPPQGRVSTSNLGAHNSIVRH